MYWSNLFFLIGVIALLYALYKDQINYMKRTQKVKVKFIPRTIYEEQFNDKERMKKVQSIYTNIYPNFPVG